MIFNFNTSIKHLFSIVVILFAAQTHAATLTWDGDQLTGVTGLEALGETWNVSFIDGTYEAVYALSDPMFLGLSTDAETARDALTLVLSDNTALISSPTDIFSCVDSFICYISTPYLIQTSGTINNWGTTVVSTGGIGSEHVTTNPTTDYSTVTFTHWDVATVPVPAAVWLFGSGLFGLISIARRKIS